MGRAEQVGLEHPVGLHHIGQVEPAPPAEAAYVVVGVVAYAVPPRLHLGQQVGILLGILAHHEEGGLGPIPVQHVQDKRGGLGDGAVIEGEIHDPLPPVHPPQGVRVYPSEEYRRLLYDHFLSPSVASPGTFTGTFRAPCSTLGVMPDAP